MDTELKRRNELHIRNKIDVIPQEGGQELVLMSNADFTLIGGMRGGGKSFSLVLDPLYDIHNPEFRAMVYRKELNQLIQGGGLYDTASKIYPHLDAVGTSTPLKFTFPSGAAVFFDHIQNESKEVIEKRFKGMQYPCIMIDEIDMLKFFTVVQMMGSNRNTNKVHTRNRIIGSCNPSVDKWTRKWLNWYIGEDGYIIPERNNTTRYYYIYGKTVDEVIWGDTVEDCYLNAKTHIDPLLGADGDYRKFIGSFKFIQMLLSENKKMEELDPKYRAKVAMGGASHAARNLLGNWNIAEDQGDEMVSRACLELMFDNEAKRTGRMRLSIDVALEGKDKCTFWVWDGLHIVDVIARPYLKSADLKAMVQRLMEQYNIRINDVYYDKVGNGSPAMDDYPLAYGIEANARPLNEDRSFDRLRSQVLWKLGTLLQEGMISCEESTSYKLFTYGLGQQAKKWTLRDILHNEMRALLIDDKGGKTKILSKKGTVSMKSILGFSPDFLEGMAYGIVHTLFKTSNRGFRGLENL